MSRRSSLVNSRNWYATGVPGYGRPGPKVGGMVTISSRAPDGRIVRRRVTIAPAFDPNALSMTPLPGWTAAGSAARKVA